jgi:hypothetical protein
MKFLPNSTDSTQQSAATRADSRSGIPDVPPIGRYGMVVLYRPIL